MEFQGDCRAAGTPQVRAFGLLGLLGLLACMFACLAPASSAAAASFGAAAWGENLFRQLGDGSINASSPTPIPVSELSGVTAVAAGGAHSLALRTDGTVASWGEDEYGQLGNGGAGAGPLPPTRPGP